MKVSVDTNIKLGLAVSGGVDSMVMLELCRKAGANITVINVEHGIRGEESLRDSRFVADYCAQKGVNCLTFRVDSPAFSRKEGISIELAARRLRYGVFEELLAEKTVEKIALAHHLDDQVETILMRLFRGTGIRGLRGIVDRDAFIHPMLGFRKREIRDYAELNGVPFVEDSTNLDSEYNRNYIRKEIVPVIKLRYPNFEQAIAKMASNAAEFEDFLLKSAIKSVPGRNSVKLPIGVLDLHPVLAKKSCTEALRELGCDRDIESNHLQSILELKNAQNNAVVNLPFSVDAIREYNELVFAKREEGESFSEPFNVQKSYEFGSYSYGFEPTDKIYKGLTFDPNAVPEGAVVRTRRNEDTFKRYGGGTKSLSDYLTDIKLPARLRERLLVVAKDNVVYLVLGIEISEQVKVTQQTEKIYKINIGEHD